MDIIPEAIEDAKYNAKRMGFENTHLWGWYSRRDHSSWYQEGYRANAVIVDPPRTGLGTKLIETLLHYAPEKMVYVSCNVSTLARDLVVFDKGLSGWIHSISGHVPPYCKDRSSCEISEEVKEEWIFGKSFILRRKLSMRLKRFQILSMLDMWLLLLRLQMVRFYGLLYGRNLWRLSFMCRTSGSLQHVSTIRTDQGQAHYCFSRQASYGEGSGMPCGACREFLLELDAENRHLEFMVDYECARPLL